MPGPYDIRNDPGTYSSRLPLGLGSDSIVMSMLAPMAVEAVGSAGMRSYAHRMLGRKMGWKQVFGFGVDADVKALQNRLMNASASSGRSIVYGLNRRPRDRVFRGFSESTVDATPPGLGAGGKRVWPRHRRVRPDTRPQVSRVDKATYVVRGDRMRRVKGHVSDIRMARFNRTEEWKRRARIARAGEAYEEFASWKALRGVGVAVAALQLGTYVADITKGVSERAMDWRPRRNVSSQHEFAMPFVDTQAAFTQRQRAIMAIHDSQLTTRAILGNEAAWVHG